LSRRFLRKILKINLSAAGQDAKEVAQFIVHVGRGTDGAGNLGLEALPVAFSQAMDGDSYRAFGHV
jgi:hypothetical protein